MAGQTVTVTPVATTDTASSFCSKINANLAAIVAELARKVAPADLDLTADVSAQGHALRFLGRLLFEDVGGVTYNDAGSIYYDSGEWYLVTAAGLVQITLNGALNASSVGGIVGDYGGVNTAKVNYVHSTKLYQFTDVLSPVVWASLEAASVVLVAANGATLEVKPNAALGANAVWSLPTLPGAGTRHLLTVDTDGTVRDDDTVDQTTNFTVSQTFTAGFTSAGDQKHSDAWSGRIKPDFLAVSGSGAMTYTGALLNYLISGAAYTIRLPVNHLRVGDKITGMTVKATKTDASTINFALKKVDEGTGTVTSVLTGTTSAGAGTVTVTVATGTPAAIAASESWYLEVTGTKAGDSFGDVRDTWVHP